MKKYIIAMAMALSLASCNEDKFLEETPLDFMSGANSYITSSDYDMAVTELYYLVRRDFYSVYDREADMIQMTDMMIKADPLRSNLTSDLSVSGTIAQFYWDGMYKIIAQANTIISRIGSSSVSADDQTLYKAKALFFRGFCYRTLAYLYGGVPLQLEEVKSPKTDYVRATKEETLNQAIEDVKFAAENLPDISSVKDGEISAEAANFLLSELYLAVGKNQEAVDAATKVISNPSLALMTTRFGSRKNEDGDVYWDLFRRENQNRKSGNTEGIWVIQLETNVQGGANNTSYYFWTEGSFWAERYYAPQTGLFEIILADGTHVKPFNWPVGDYTGGRGIGTYYATNHFYRTIWESDFNNDIRNSEYNYPRKFKFNQSSFTSNPQYKAMFGDSIDLENLDKLPAGVTLVTGYSGGVTPTTDVPNRFMCGYQTKCTTPFNHPDAQYSNKSTYVLSGTGGKTYTDQYMFRLAEAYLLRAEGYLGLGNNAKAADDINVVRRRANASDVKASDVTLDYILDERMRELGIEEKRRLTLSRTGKLYERTKKYNKYYSPEYSDDGKGIQEYQALYPIPQSVIEANKDAKLEQNPGY